MKSSRSAHEGAWQDISNYMMPFRGDITTKKAKGSQRVHPVFDSTAMIAADQLVNFMKGSLLPPSQDWLRLVPPYDFTHDDVAKKTLDITAQRVLAQLADSNFYSESTSVLRDLIVLGNATLMIEEDTLSPNSNNGITFESVPIGQMWWSQGKGGRIIMVARRYQMPSIDAARFFKDPGKDALQNLSQGKELRYYGCILTHIRSGYVKIYILQRLVLGQSAMTKYDDQDGSVIDCEDIIERTTDSNECFVHSVEC